MSYVYVYDVGSGKYVVGFYDPAGLWRAESFSRSGDDAAARVHYLNGGTLYKFEPTGEALDKTRIAPQP